jgi:hypothetical protein
VFDTGGTLIVHQNPLLTSFAGLAGSAMMLASLTISDNAQLQDLAGLENLTSVDNLDIEQNDQLTTLGALGAVTRLSYLTAARNPRLPTCEVRALFRRAGGQELVVTGNNNTATCP